MRNQCHFVADNPRETVRNIQGGVALLQVAFRAEAEGSLPDVGRNAAVMLCYTLMDAAESLASEVSDEHHGAANE